MLALDTGSTVPRKLDGLTRALAAHAASGAGGAEAVAAAAAQVLSYYPNALRLDPATLAAKLEALRGAGLSSETVLRVVGGAPRCLSAAAGTLEQRVCTLREAFPLICVDGLLGQAPGLLQNRIDPGARVRVGEKKWGGGGTRGFSTEGENLDVRGAFRHTKSSRVLYDTPRVKCFLSALMCNGFCTTISSCSACWYPYHVAAAPMCSTRPPPTLSCPQLTHVCLAIFDSVFELPECASCVKGRQWLGNQGLPVTLRSDTEKGSVNISRLFNTETQMAPAKRKEA